MQVTQVQDRVTHAVIGGQVAQSFGIVDTAEFFHVLSSTLYSRKEEAMVREIVCNAWDAHIESGNTKTPIKITLNYDQLIIQDFGLGIAPEMIGPIYGTYGGSTKKDNGQVTGGFGLGSKAPFAYADHFEVTSCHNGIKTIYKMSLSSAVVGGKPSITPIVSVPTQEHGLTVSIKLKDQDDYRTIQTLVHKIVTLGEISCLFNDELLDTIPFSSATDKFLIVRSNLLAHGNTHDSVMVRYGNVTYPIQTHRDYSSLYESALDFLGKINSSGNRDRYGQRNLEWALILQADPDTISITPSRESLSMTDHTIGTIQSLLENFHDHISRRFNKAVVEESRQIIESNWMMGSPGNLFQDRELPIPKGLRAKSERIDYISDLKDVGNLYVHGHYPNIDGFKNTDFLMRLDALITGGFGNQYIAKMIKRAYVKGGQGQPEKLTNLHIRKIVWPMIKRIQSNKSMDMDRLFLFSRSTDRWGNDSELKFVPARRITKMTYTNIIRLIRNVVILSHNRIDVTDRAPQFPVVRHWLGDIENSFVYIVPRNSKKTDEARAFWTDAGMTVIDLTVAQSWEPKDITQPISTMWPSKPKKKGLPVLTSALHSNGRIDSRLPHDDKAARIEMPEFIVRLPYTTEGWNEFQEELYSSTVSQTIIHLYGKVGGVVANANQTKKFLALGAKMVQDYVLNKITEAFTTNPNIETHFRWKVDSLNFGGYRKEGLYDILREDPEFRAKYALPNPLSKDEQSIVFLFENMIPNSYSRKLTPVLVDLDKLILSWSNTPEALKLAAKIKASDLAGTIDYSAVRSMLISPTTKTPEAQKKKIREFLLLALEG